MTHDKNKPWHSMRKGYFHVLEMRKLPRWFWFQVFFTAFPFSSEPSPPHTVTEIILIWAEKHHLRQ